MDKLTPKQQKALDALLRCCTQEAAAREAGVGRRTLTRWLAQSGAFQRALRDAEQDALKRIHRRLAELPGWPADVGRWPADALSGWPPELPGWPADVGRWLPGAASDTGCITGHPQLF